MLRYLPFILFLLASSCLCKAQDLHSLFPWIKLDGRVQFAMREDALKAIYPSLKPMSGIDASGGGKPQPSELYIDPERQILGIEDVAFGVKNGLLTKFYWSSSARAEPTFLKQTRASLREALGKPEVGYKARLTKDRIAKVTTEVYSPSSLKNIVITLSSALGTTELEVINMAAEGVTTAEMYFSYEKQKQQLQIQLAGITGKEPAEAPASATNDLMTNLDDTSTNESSAQAGTPPPSVQPPAMKNGPGSKPSEPSSSEVPTSSTPWSVLVTIIVAALGLLWLMLKRRS